jgi:type III restriction enzyme
VSELINNEKAATLISNVTYHKTGEEFDDVDTFTINNFSGTLQENILEVKKHIYDFVKVDSENEKKFAENLEK